MRILWVKPILPYPPRQGTSRVTLHLLRALSPGNRIRFFAPLRSPGEAEGARALAAAFEGLEVTAPLAPNRRSPLHRAGYRVFTRWQALRGRPPIESYIAAAPLLEAFAGEARDFAPDFVVAEYWYARRYLDVAPGVPGALLAHDLEYALRQDAPRGARDAARGERYAAMEERREKEALRTAPFVWFLTPGDRARADRECAVPPARGAVMPYGLDLDREFRPRGDGDPPESPKAVLLFGSFLADFNRDALRFTLEEVWPALRRLAPGAALRVAGGGLTPELAARCRAAGASVAGEVADVRGTLLEAAVVLVPLRFGGGLRIRLLEALALERAVVGTPAGVLGMGPEAGREVLVGSSAAELAGQVARALGDPPLRRALGAAGRSFVERTHAGPAAAAEARRVLDESAGRPALETR